MLNWRSQTVAGDSPAYRKQGFAGGEDYGYFGNGQRRYQILPEPSALSSSRDIRQFHMPESQIPRRVLDGRKELRYAFSDFVSGLAASEGTSNPMRRLLAGSGSMSSRMVSTSP